MIPSQLGSLVPGVQHWYGCGAQPCAQPGTTELSPTQGATPALLVKLCNKTGCMQFEAQVKWSWAVGPVGAKGACWRGVGAGGCAKSLTAENLTALVHIKGRARVHMERPAAQQYLHMLLK